MRRRSQSTDVWAPGLVSARQLPGRFVRTTDPRLLPLWRANAERLLQEWEQQPAFKAERDARFYRGRDAHHGPLLTQFTCCAVVRGRRCSRISIVETGYKHCIRHAGPTHARLYRENQRKLFESGRIPAGKWFKDEARRARTRIRDRQRRKDWTLPGLTVRFADSIEAAFQADAALVLGGWS